MDQIKIFDTTLRDGEQSPGFSMNVQEKLALARQLARLRVDVIEAGFPAASEQDFEAVRAIAEEVGEMAGAPTICGLARALPRDIERCWEAVKPAKNARLHLFLATSDIHMRHKLNMDRGQVLETLTRGVQIARSLCDDVEFSPEDASRSDFDFLCEAVEAAIEAGATTINIPDTVGYATPAEWANRIGSVIERVPCSDRAVFSVHCHNDLGLAVANSLAAVEVGARQIECTINGIGERAGNASLEEVVMAIHTRKDVFQATTGIDTRELYPTSRMLTHLTGIHVQPNKAIVGENAFAHEAGIHQHGVLQERLTYEIMKAEDVGRDAAQIVLGKHSGRHALAAHIAEMGIEMDGEQLDQTFVKFKRLADKKKKIYYDDLLTLLSAEYSRGEEVYSLDYLHVLSGTAVVPSATIAIDTKDGKLRGSAVGDGPVDAVLRAIESATGISGQVTGYATRGATEGADALGEVSMAVTVDGKTAMGHGSSTDTLQASARAYLDALNRLSAVAAAGVNSRRGKFSRRRVAASLEPPAPEGEAEEAVEEAMEEIEAQSGA